MQQFQLQNERGHAGTDSATVDTQTNAAFMSTQMLLRLLLVVVLLPLSSLQPIAARLEAFTGAEPRDAVSTRFSVSRPPMNSVEFFGFGSASNFLIC